MTTVARVPRWVEPEERHRGGLFEDAKGSILSRVEVSALRLGRDGECDKQCYVHYWASNQKDRQKKRILDPEASLNMFGKASTKSVQKEVENDKMILPQSIDLLSSRP